MVTNDFQQLTLDFATQWTALAPPGRAGPVPGAAAREIDEVNADVYARRQQRRLPVRFRRPQDAYERGVPAALRPAGRCPTGCATRRYLVGDTITEADVRLFVTLVRFDAVYHGHFKCNRQKLTEMPVLWAYAATCSRPRASATPSTSTRSSGTTTASTPEINPTGIVPAGPDLSGWLTPHGREELGGRPFGDGTPPGPPPADEAGPVPATR